MEIKRPKFEQQQIQIRETWQDEEGHVQERIRLVSVPTGGIVRENDPVRQEEK